MKKPIVAALFIVLLTPALSIAASPTLKVLVDALVVCPPDSTARFVDNGDGTICDRQIGLMWEKKVLDASSTNPRAVSNSYSWTSVSGGIAPNGTVFTDFLARLNGEIAATSASEQLGGYRDWRVPTSAELQTILDCSFGSPCIDPVFGPTAAAGYWTSTTNSGDPTFGWVVVFSNGGGTTNTKKDIGSVVRVRAVRGGR